MTSSAVQIVQNVQRRKGWEKPDEIIRKNFIFASELGEFAPLR